MRSQTPVGFRPGALASAQEFEGVHISVFSDRVEDACSLRTMPVLLAHVFAHEITHVLEGIDRHSHDGLMKAHWTGRDIAQMASHPLAFDPHDVDLIHKGLARRGNFVKSLL
ncbi:MAG: hypothetical protein JOZ22_16475 [Acidobacteriia bacterium]|nr:hypothetical protein [Terriglobia bacterium]